MDAPVYKKLVDLENLNVNPRNSSHGMNPVVIQKSFAEYLQSIGNPKNGYLSTYAMGPYVDTTFHYSTLYQPSIGMIFYPLFLSVTPDTDCSVGFKITTGLSGPSNTPTDMYFMRYIKARDEFRIQLNEGILQCFADGGGKIAVGVATDTTNVTVKINATVYGIEVTPDV